MTPRSISQLREVLDREKVRRSLDDVRREVIAQVRGATGTDPMKLSTGQQEPALAPGWFASAVIQACRPLYQAVLKENIIERLDRPVTITVEDLAESFREHLVVDDDDFIAAYGRFCVSVILKAWTGGTGEATPVATVPDPLESLDANQSLWSNNWREIQLAGLGPRESFESAGTPNMFDPRVVLFARVRGLGTDRALRQFGSTVQRLLQSTLRSFSILEYCSRLKLSDIETHSVLPYVVDHQWPVFLPLVKDCLSIYFSLPSRSDTMHYRVGIALQLLVEVDRQPNHAIALALCFAAIEAMLSKSKTDITRSLSENAMALLEPEVVHRQAAARFVADLYSCRSRVLHGEALDHPEALRTKSRILAAAILVAVLQRREFLERCGAEAKPKEFFAELEEARITARVIPGVPASNAVVLWRGHG